LRLDIPYNLDFPLHPEIQWPTAAVELLNHLPDYPYGLYVKGWATDTSDSQWVTHAEQALDYWNTNVMKSLLNQHHIPVELAISSWTKDDNLPTYQGIPTHILPDNYGDQTEELPFKPGTTLSSIVNWYCESPLFGTCNAVPAAATAQP